MLLIKFLFIVISIKAAVKLWFSTNNYSGNIGKHQNRSYLVNFNFLTIIHVKMVNIYIYIYIYIFDFWVVSYLYA